MNDGPKRDWEKTRLHFVCGVILGSLSAFASGGTWIAVGIVALATGLLAAIFLDRFWHGFLSIWNWFV